MTFQLLLTPSVSFSNIELPRTTGTIRHSNTRGLITVSLSTTAQSRDLYCTRGLPVLGNCPSQQFNLPYLIAGPRSADLQPLSRPRTFWQYLSTRDDARFEILTISFFQNSPSLLPAAVEYLTPGLLNISFGAVSFGRIWYACGQRGLAAHGMKTGLHVWLRTLTCIILTVYFSMHHVQSKSTHTSIKIH